jgi:hypothetical protein
MATTATFDTYKAVGIREDLADVIYNIAPTDTPFVSNIASGTAKGIRHEWQKDTLASPADSRVAEGATASMATLDATTRLYNLCQINQKALTISGSDLVADNAGRGVEMAYQEAKKGLELRRDIEYTCVFVNRIPVAGAGNSGGSPTARGAATLQGWLSSNVDVSATGTPSVKVANPGESGWTAMTLAGTDRAFTEGLLTGIIDEIYLEGGNPDMIMANTKQKRVITDSFVGRADSIVDQDLKGKRIVSAVDFYESDYGVLSIVPNRYMITGGVYVLDSEMWEISYYRPFMTKDLAVTGDNESKQMIVEWTLTSKQEAASGAIYDLS